ncbi:uncharacterized protein LOC135332303 [Halichondria panicea]|uniref:uncharacterized protein LOC135332303 n=1 Tax=Halichondria panicea TaxID=6063 RepID=UPI00312B7EA1
MEQQYVQAGWAPAHPVVHMEYAGFAGGHPPPFTSPPATPMTPMTPVTPHHAFPMPQYDLPNHYNSHPPPPPQYTPPPDYRLFALCQHLSQNGAAGGLKDRDSKFWWEEFMNEFFHEAATLVIEVDLGEGTRKFRLSRQWIPFYFKSFFENGVTSLHLCLGEGSSTYHQGLLEMEFRNTIMETHHSSPQPTKVCTSGSLIVDFTLEEKPRIISWYFHINDHMEFVPRKNTTHEEPTGVLSNITCRGLLPATQKLLFEVGLMDYQETPRSAGINSTIAAVTSGCQWPSSQPPQLISMGGDQFQITSEVPGQPAALMNGHVQAAPTDSTIKLSCNKVTSPIATPTSMMVATEAVLLGDTTDILSLCVGGEERRITKVHCQQKQVLCSPHHKMDAPVYYNHSNVGAWGAHVKREQLTQ